MSDLDKLMAKMNDNKKPVEKPAEKPTEIPAEKPVEKPVEKPAEKPTEIPAEIHDDTDDEDVEKTAEKPVEQVPAQHDDQSSVGEEVAVLQNEGIFRRELILILKEFVDVHKVNTQTLIDIKKKLLGEEDATKED